MENFINVDDYIGVSDFPDDDDILQSVTFTQVDKEDNDECDPKDTCPTDNNCDS